MAKDVGLTSADIRRIAAGPETEGWTLKETALIKAVDELHASALIGDNSWRTLSVHLDEAQLIELMVLVGSYRLLAGILNSVGIRPPGGTSPDLPGNTFAFTP
jgi:hypothetical protein